MCPAREASVFLGGWRGGGAKKVVFDSPLLVDFVIGLVNSVFNLSYGEVKVFRGI